MSIFDKRINYKPFEYPEVYQFIDAINKSFWVHSEVDFTADVQDFNTNLNEKEQNVIKNSLLAIAQIEVNVKSFWGDLYKVMPKPEMNGLGSTFSENETRHSEAYSRLVEVLGYNDEFESLVEVPVIKERIKYLSEALSGASSKTEEGRKKYITSLILFALLIENVSLFSQFAIMLSFTRFKGYMKNVSNIIAWTSLDEQCMIEGTEVMTPNGWRLLSEMSIGDDVYGFNEGELVVEKVTNTTKKPFVGNLKKIGNSRHESITTPDHDMIVKHKNHGWIKTKSVDLVLNHDKSFPVTAEFKGGDLRGLTYEERLKIAIQGDGCRIYNGRDSDGVRKERGINGGCNYTLSLTNGRKINRLRDILKNIEGLKWSERDMVNNDSKYTLFRIAIDNDNDYKTFEWVDLNGKSKVWCEEFIEEVLNWDGYVSKTGHGMCYTNTNKPSIDTVQLIAVLAGYRTNVYENRDSERSENFNNCYKVNISNKDKGTVITKHYKKEDVEYNGYVYCVSVPSGGIVTRYNDSVFITGNCHANAGIFLINTIKKEFPEFFDDELIKQVNRSIHKSIEVESRILDWIFEKGEIETINKKDLLNFMKYRVDDSLRKIGFEPQFNITQEDYSKMMWFEEEIFANSLDDFFAKRPVDYTKHDKSISANDLF